MYLLYFKNIDIFVLNLLVFIIVKNHLSCKRFLLVRGKNQRLNIQTIFFSETLLFVQRSKLEKKGFLHLLMLRK